MKFLIFVLTYPFIWFFSRLPMPVLYVVSDFLFIIIYYIVGYRKNVIFNNLKLVFPNKSDKELKTLTKKSTKHFTDFIVETVKTFSISEKTITKRYKYRNLEVLKQFENSNGIILTGCHYANWEWVIYLAKLVNFLPVGVYKKIQNPYFEKIIKSSRSKFGGILRRTSETKKSIIEDKKNGIKALYLLLSDQSPSSHITKHWSNFLGINVPVIVGAEELAKKHNFAVINFNVFRIKRGYYEVEFEILTDTPKNLKNYEITNRYLASIEKHIRKQPEFYLWSHKRFKHKNRYNEWLATMQQ